MRDNSLDRENGLMFWNDAAKNRNEMMETARDDAA
jgi:hypothetical protein